MSIFARVMRRHPSLLPRATVQRPAQISGVSVANETETTADISWTADPLVIDLNPGYLPGIYGYEVKVTDSLGATAFTSTTQATSLTATGLTASTGYDVIVRGYNNDGAGPWSAPVSFTTAAGTAAPDAPTGVAVTVIDNEGPTAITLSNQTTSLAEDTDTTSRIHLADITLTDDGMGTNVITVDNPSYFEIYQGSLYLVAGASLDYETATSHSCTISAVDSTTNDAAVTQAFTLTVTDVFELAPPDAPTGVAVTVSEDPAATTDPYWQETTLLLQESLSDESSYGQTVTASGTAALSTTSKVGNYSVHFPAAGDRLTVADDFSELHDKASDYTIEFWFQTASTSGRICLLETAAASASSGILLEINNGAIDFSVYRGVSGSFTTLSGGSVSTNTWHHVAVSATTSTITLYVDGQQAATTAWSLAGSASASQTNLTIGADTISVVGDLNGYIDSLRITVGHARYTSAFTPPSAAFPTAEPVDEFFSATVLLLQDSLADESYQGHTLTINGNTALDASNAKVGNYGIAFDGNGDYIQTTVDSSLHITGDCTIEFWMKSSGPNSQRIISHRSSASGDANLLGVFLSSGKPYFRIGPDVMNGTTAVNDGQWHHIACVRSGSNQYIFVDGAVAATRTTTSYSFNPVGLQLYIGRDPFDSQYYNGVIDGFRFTNGTARYTTAFTPSDEPMPRSNGDPDFASVDLLLQDSLVDQSLSGQTVVASGNAALSTAQVKYGTQSIYFDGNGDYLTTSALPLGTADYTLESWLYIDTLTYQPFLFTGIPHNQSGSHLWVCLNLGGGYGITVGYTGGGPSGQIKSTTTPAAGQWYHLAVVRNGGVTTVYLDGSSIVSGSQHNGINLANSQPEIGNESNSNRGLNGFVDSFRLTAGVARYTANFTPPTTEFPN